MVDVAGQMPADELAPERLDQLRALSLAVAEELQEALELYEALVSALVEYLAATEPEPEDQRLIQNSALSAAIDLADLGRTLDELDREQIPFVDVDDPRAAREFGRVLADSFTLILAAREREDFYQLNLADPLDLQAWSQETVLGEWFAHHLMLQS